MWSESFWEGAFAGATIMGITLVTVHLLLTAVAR